MRKTLAAAGLLLASACAPTSRFSEEQLARLSTLAGQVETERLMGHVRALTRSHQEDTPLSCTQVQREQYAPACFMTRDRARDLMKSQLEAVGLQVRTQEGQHGALGFTNLIADLPGTTWPEELVLVGAHFDAHFMGADDNSTGVAGVLELARVLSQYRFERTLRFVGFDLEEPGMLGSGHYVDMLGQEKLAGVIIFDCIGYYDTRPGSQKSLPGLPAPDTGDFLAIMGNDHSLGLATELHQLNDALGLMKLVSIIAPGDGTSTVSVSESLMRSDHAAFWYAGHKALFLTDTADFRNPHYHEATDVIDTLAPESFRRAVQISAVGLAAWAGGPQ
ncbi:peptidase M28-like protein [Archangium gephyra]|uniref:Aminopeptidase n=1 Tax=Archangium gephyra TaxID=48 RepID=A0AAC8Q7N2_9BACT|nr:M28 family peptidase [Archangium gephyra]AKJ02450.1 putative aminopeptidase [Archangium gephyra]REG28626.1 peptidase M28-like protein [Archangium gephyra]